MLSSSVSSSSLLLLSSAALSRRSVGAVGAVSGGGGSVMAVVSSRRGLATGTRGSRGHGWYHKYRDGRGGRHLQGKWADRNDQELRSINERVFSMGSTQRYLDVLVPNSQQQQAQGDEENTNDSDKSDKSTNKIIRLELELASAALPMTCTNFERLCDDGYYQDTLLFRIERNVGLCFGELGSSSSSPANTTASDDSRSNGINNNYNNNKSSSHCHPSLGVAGRLPTSEPLVLSHLAGVVTMMAPGVDQVDSRFVLLTKEAPQLDGRFVPFGRLTETSLAQAQLWSDTLFTKRGIPTIDLKIVGAGSLKEEPDGSSGGDASSSSSSSGEAA